VTHPPTRPGRQLEPATAVCAAMYLADRVADPVPAYAFVFRLPSTDTRFTIYTADPDRYLIGATLTLAAPGERPLSLDPEDWKLLAHCLELVAERWAEAAEQTDAAATTQTAATDLTAAHGAQRRAPAQTEQADTISVEPTPSGYQHMGRMFRDELDRVQRLRRRVGPLLHPTDDGETTAKDGESS
jgi:hypothetical protein